MLNVTDLIGFGSTSAIGTITAKYVGGTISGNNSGPWTTNVTFSSGYNKVLLVVSAGNTTPTFSTVTVNSVECVSNLIQQQGNVAAFYGNHPGAGTFAIAVNVSAGGGNNGSIHAYEITGSPLFTPYDTDVNEATNTIDCPTGGFIVLFGRDSSGAADTMSVGTTNILNASSSYGGDSASFATGFINMDGSTADKTGGTKTYAISSDGSRLCLSFVSL